MEIDLAKEKRMLNIERIDLINKEFFFSIDLFSVSKQIRPLIRARRVHHFWPQSRMFNTLLILLGNTFVFCSSVLMTIVLKTLFRHSR